MKECPVCEGEGSIQEGDEQEWYWETCPKCEGKGTLDGSLAWWNEA